MLKTILWVGGALLVITAVLLLFPLAINDLRLIGITFTSNASTGVTSANDEVSRAQDILNIVIGFTAVLGLVLTALSVVGVVLSILGVRSLNEVHALSQDLRNNMEKVRVESNKTRDALTYLALGDRLLNQKNITEALIYYKKAGNLLPNDAQLQYVLGRIYSEAGDYLAAIAILEASYKTLQTSPSQEDTETRKEIARVLKELRLAYRRRATGLNQNDDYLEAIRYLKLSLSYDGQDNDAHCILGGLYRCQQEYKQAYQAYKEAYDIDRHSSYAPGNLASLSWYLDKVDEAKKYFEDTEHEAKKLLEKGEGETYWNLYDLALAQLALRKTNDANETYIKAIHLTPGLVQFDGVIDNLRLLKQASQQIHGLDEVIKMVENARKKLK
jgi:tetratricopeptide (TPR) repeat protein